MRKAYPSDLTDAQWTAIEPVLPPAKPGGRPRKVDLREIVNTLFYQNRTGCQWDYLPHDRVQSGKVFMPKCADVLSYPALVAQAA
jgi:putative transposase